MLTRCQEGRLLKINETSTLFNNFAQLTEKGNLSTTMQWHERFGHICYDKIHIMKKNGFDGFHVFSKCVKKCEV